MIKNTKLSFLACAIGMAIVPFSAHAASDGEAMVNPNGGVVVGYWHDWCGGSGYKGGTAPCVALSEVNPQYNVVDVSFMKAYPGSSIPTFRLDPAIGLSEAQFIAQIGELNRQGRSVLLALGGADAHIELKTGQEQDFADELIRLTDYYGFDGIDIDLEQSAITAADNQKVIPAALRMVKEHYRAEGKNFLITMAPEFPYLTNGGAYVPYLQGLEGYYDWINPQFYNQGGDGIYIDGIGWIAQNNDNLKQEFIYYISDSLVNGTRGYYKIPHNKLVFGIPSSNDAAATGFVKDPQDLYDAFNQLKAQGQPLRGVMTWSINWDMGKNSAGQAYDQAFIKSYGPFIHGQVITPPPSDGVPVLTGVTDTRVKQRSTFDPLAGVSASDREDGDLSGQIQVEGSVNTQQVGLYPLTYRVIDSDNHSVEQLRKVEVYSAKPTFSGVSSTTITVGSAFDPLSGVMAVDEEDGDLTAQIQVAGQVDSARVGSYTLTYQVSDSANQQVSQQRVVQVTEPGAACGNAWDKTKVYLGGDTVSHAGKTWSAGWWTQGEEPGKSGQWGVWREKGDCASGGEVTPPTPEGATAFTVSGLAQSYELNNGVAQIAVTVQTNGATQIEARIEQQGAIKGSVSTSVSGTQTLNLSGVDLVAGSAQVVIVGDTDATAPATQNFNVTLNAAATGGDEGSAGGDYPAYAAGSAYKAGDRVSSGGANYECKPWPYSGWCSGQAWAYEPGKGTAWADAWNKL